MPHRPPSLASGCCLLLFAALNHRLLLSAPGCCLTVRCPWRLAAASLSAASGGCLLSPPVRCSQSRSATLGGWLLPHSPLSLAAGCCLTVRCLWRLVAASSGSLLSITVCCSWRLAAAFSVILQFSLASLPRVDAVPRPDRIPRLKPLLSVVSRECLGRAVTVVTWVRVVITHGDQRKYVIY